DTGKVDLQSMVDWFSANSTATPDLGQRAVGAVIAPAAEDGYAAGDEVTIDLSSLAFSTGEAVPTEVEFSIGGTVLGTAPVTVDIVDAFDEAGQATFTFQVPADAAGQTLVAMPNVGDAVTLPVVFSEAGGEPGPFEGSIELGSAKASAGGTLSITGEGYTPGETVTVELRSKKGESVVFGEIVVGDDGAFDATVSVPRDVQPGKHTVAVVQADGDEATATVTVNRAGGIGSWVRDLIRWVVDLF